MNVLRVLALTRYGPQGASSRVRLLQFVPWLESAGLKIDVAPFFDDDYLAGLYSDKVPLSSVIRSYLRRLQKLRGFRQYDLIWVEKEILPWVPFGIEKYCLGNGIPIVVDFDDAVFHRYGDHKSAVVRSLLGSKIDQIMARADLVIVGNEYLARHARDAGSNTVRWLPTVIDLERYTRSGPKTDDHEPIVVGWIGSPATAHFLELVAPALEMLRSRLAIRCVAVGARPNQVVGTPFEAWDWSEIKEVSLIRQFDIGIMPLPDTPFERGKCGYKLIQYMACGLPIVASPVGVNVELVSPNVGFLATTQEDWSDAIESLVKDVHMRNRLGSQGRRLVEESYCLQVQAPRFVQMLNDVVEGVR